MQFKQPEVLYALLLLLIPILIHLFQLRRFQRIDFTNVAFLKKVTIQTRKSSRLKKLITLLLRLLALACIVLAFAQPFSASDSAMDVNRKTVLYLDNSFSMQATGPNGPLLSRAIQQMYDHVRDDGELSWFTNSDEYRNISLEDFKSEVLKTQYSGSRLDGESVIFKAAEMMSDENEGGKRLIYISDLQQTSELPKVPEDIELEVVQLKPVAANNISIDTAYLETLGSAQVRLIVQLSTQGEVPDNVPVSLFKNNTLSAKVAADFSSGNSARLNFDLELSESFKGKLEITDSNLLYDNDLYFSVNTQEQIKVLSINDTDSDFLNRLYAEGNFSYSEQDANNLNYSDIVEQNFVVLNELQTIPPSLIDAITTFVSEGGSLMIIPAEQADLNTYNRLLGALEMGVINRFEPREKSISRIAFSHPLYAGVFEKEVANFQFPRVNGYYRVSSMAAPALSYQDGSAFLLQKDKIYLFSAPINSENSNFQNSPLIVPTGYNMALQSLPLPELYMEIARQNDFSLPVRLGQDEILTIRDSITEFIPLQQTKANSVDIQTNVEPIKAGNYEVIREQQPISNVSYNYQRNESILNYHDAEEWEGSRVFSSIESLFDMLNKENAVSSYWKWFVIFAVLFLLAEMLVLKFYKN